jgi:hypothetical protein
MKGPVILEFFEPLMDDMNARLCMYIKQPTRREHGNEVLGRNPFELL